MPFGMRRVRLQWKIIAWSFVPTAIILTLVALAGFFAYVQVTENLTIASSRELARLSAGQLAGEVSEFGQILSSVARSPDFYDTTQPGRKAALQRTADRLAIFDAGTLIIDNSGVIAAAQPESLGLVKANWSQQPIFRTMIETPGTTYGEIIGDEPGELRVIIVAVPIVGPQGEMLGTLGGMFHLGATSVSSFYAGIIKLRLGTEDTVYLVDRNGQVLYHTDLRQIGADFSSLPVVQMLSGNQGGAFRTTDYTGKDIVAGYSPVPGTPWGIVIEQNWVVLLASGQRYGQSLLFLLALGLLAPAIVVTIGVRRITEPIKRLTAVTREVASGNLGKVITVDTGDELEELGDQFNLMSQKLSQSYAALRLREERLALVMRGTNDGYWDWDLRTNQVYLSPRWKSMLGYEDIEVANRSDAWRNLIHPDDSEYVLGQLDAHLDGKLPVFQVEHRLRHKDGTYRWILARGMAQRDADGKAVRIAGSHTDVTARRHAEESLKQAVSDLSESEERFRATFEQAAVGISHVSPDGKWLWVNQRLCDIVGYTRDQLLRMNFRDLTFPEDLERDLELLSELLAGQRSTFTLEKRYVRIDKEIIWVNLTVSLVRGDGDKPKYIVSVVQDITERKQAEEEIARQNEYLRALHQTALGIITELDIEELLQTTVEHAVELVGGAFGWVYLVDQDQATLKLKVATGVFHDQVGVHLKRGEGLAGRIWETGEPQIVDDYQSWSYRSFQFKDQRIGSALGVPLWSRGQVIGVIGLSRDQDRGAFVQGEMELMTRFAHLASIALENANLHSSLQSELEQRTRAQQALQDRLAFERLITGISTDFINREPNQIDRGIHQALQEIGDFTGSDRSYVFLFSEDGARMHNTHEWCREGIASLQSLYSDQPCDLLDYSTSRLKQSQYVYIPSTRDLPPEAAAEAARYNEHADAPLSVVAVPMVYHGRVMGFLGFDSVRAEKEWSEDGISLLRIVGEIFVNALEHKRAQQALRKSEARFRTMFQNAGIGMAISDSEEQGVEANPALSHMLGYSLEELSNLFTEDYTYPEDLPAQMELEKEVEAGARDQYELEKRYIHKDGHVVWGRMVRSVARGEKGDILLMMGMVEDITDRKRAQEQLELANQTLERRVEERTHELAVLNSIAAVVSRSLDLREIMSDALDKTVQAVDMQVGIAYRVEFGDGDPNPYLTPLASHGVSDQFYQRMSHLSLDDELVRASTDGAPIVWHTHDHRDHEHREALLREGIECGVSVPLLVQGNLVGAILVGNYADRPVKPEELALLGGIRQQVAIAVENARLYQAEQDRREEAERRRLVAEGLRGILAVLNSNRPLSEILDYIIQQANALLQADAGFVFRFDSETRVAILEAKYHMQPDLEFQSTPLADTQGNRALLNRQVVAITDLKAYIASEFDSSLGEEAVPAWYRNLAKHYSSILSVPLVTKDRLYGGLFFCYLSRRRFSDEDIRLGMALADQTVLAIENAQLRARAEQSAVYAERSRLARELHDSVTQSLYSVTLYAEASARLLTAGNYIEAASHMRDLRDTAMEALREMRLLIFELRPPALERGGLGAAIQTRLDSVESRGGMHAELYVSGKENLPLTTQAELYNIAQEALNNALKHAGAQRVQVNLTYGEAGVEMEVCDDGIGFDLELARQSGGFGISGMEERTQRIRGNLEVSSHPGEGTRVRVRVPIQAADQGGSQ